MSRQHQVQIALDKINKEMGRRLNKAANFLVETIQDNVSFQGPPRSKPGQLPHKDSGDLYQSIDKRLDTWVAVVRATVPYASYLEEGTEKMAPREFMGPSLEEAKADIARILAGKNPTYSGGTD